MNMVMGIETICTESKMEGSRGTERENIMGKIDDNDLSQGIQNSCYTHFWQNQIAADEVSL